MENFKSAERKTRAELSFGRPGHEWEYTFIPDTDAPIPSEISDQIQGKLGDEWDVVNRSNRIEIRNKTKLGTRDDKKITVAFETAKDRYDFQTYL